MDNPVFLSQNVLSNTEGISLTVSLSEDVTIRILRANKRMPSASTPLAPGLVSHARWRCQEGRCCAGDWPDADDVGGGKELPGGWIMEWGGEEGRSQGGGALGERRWGLLLYRSITRFLHHSSKLCGMQTGAPGEGSCEV